MRNTIIINNEMSLNRRKYVRPSTTTLDLTTEEAYLAATSPEIDKSWNPEDNNDSGTIHIWEETDGNLGGPGSEITGAKQFQDWDVWD